MTELPLILSAMAVAFAAACGVLAAVAIGRAAYERARRLDAEERADSAGDRAAFAEAHLIAADPSAAQLLTDIYDMRGEA